MYYARPNAFDSGALVRAPQLDGVIVSIAYRGRHGLLIRRARRVAKNLMLSPDTHLLAFQSNLERPSLRSLPYAARGPITPDRYSDDDALRTLVSEVIQAQEDGGADSIIAPFLLPESPDHHAFNLRLIRETLESTDRTVMAVICVPRVLALDSNAMGRLTSDYAVTGVAGYVALFDGFQETRNAVRSVRTVIDGVRVLSQSGKDVLIGSIGPFGLPLMAEGAAGFSSGLVWTDHFRSSAIKRPPRPGPTRGIRRTRYQYIPEAFGAFTAQEMEVLRSRNLVPECSCPGCAQGDPADDEGRKVHLLHRRSAEAAELARLSLAERRRLLRERLRRAEREAGQISRVLNLGPRFDYLGRWREALGW